MLPASIESNSPLLLSPSFMERVLILQKECTKIGVDLRFGCTLRGPILQAAMWCRSRSIEEVASRRKIISVSAPKLASLLLPELAGLGPPCTNSLPGLSWHQWGEAVDAYAVIGNISSWSQGAMQLVWKLATELGLHGPPMPGKGRSPHRSWHIQARSALNPAMVPELAASLADVEARMIAIYDIQ